MYNYRKFGPGDREYPIFELGEDSNLEPLLDCSKNDDGVLELAFHISIADKTFTLDEFQRLLAEGIELAQSEE